MSALITFNPPSRTRRPGIVAGIGVSLLLHAVLLFGYRLSSPPAQVPAQRSMTVWLQPPKPVKLPPQLAKAEPPPPAKTATPTRSKPAPAAVTAAVQPQPAQPAETLAATPAPDPLYPDQQPKKFNMDEALKIARSVAKDKAAPGTLAAQLDAHPLYPEDHQTQLQKGVASAKKYDCLQAGAGAGLLAPLIWALDKHCKF
ncbi:hypothetical protein GJ699_09675 [Duganella sp. FT80W]|uniref:Uncharacterized protein n=1 Tax=Duganella guangzhouensis TaxID=2666084 RepID=A0A6I2KWW8_9BURK|nr:hypothetical protein [Duganella guangzhouensis]MRW90253.1 hypothetical protein [Duganella guangzhouensis]